jgi:hypothetical protein
MGCSTHKVLVHVLDVMDQPPSTTLSTTNPTWLDPGLNPGRRGGKPATNRLSYGAAQAALYLQEYSWYWSVLPVDYSRFPLNPFQFSIH